MTHSPKPLPDHITPYAFDFRWDNTKLWKVEGVPLEQMDIKELVWHFDIPWLHTPGERFNLTPSDIMANPDIHIEEYSRTMAADISFPIDIMYNKGRWLILDGLHRLMKQVAAGETSVSVRKIPRAVVPLIEVSDSR